MDELFGEVGFAAADRERKEKIEADIGLTALLNGEDVPLNTIPEKRASVADKSDSDDNGAKVEDEKTVH